jgi:predicted TPR repeat methyltransferase
MKLTVEQALQKSVSEHKVGNIAEAERLYRAILQVQPAHPDANHNLGLLAVSINKIDMALPLFNAALKANPKIEQFWLSYIDALLAEKQFKNAKRVIKKAKMVGFLGEKFKAAEIQLIRSTQGRAKQSSVGLNPSETEIDSLLTSYKNGKYDEAEEAAILVTREFPNYQFGWKVLGAIFGQKGKKVEAINANQRALQLTPDDAKAYSNLGVTLKEMNRLEEAEASYKQAIALKPEYAKAHNNLGVTLQEQGKLEEAEASYKQAIALKPEYAEAHNNLGVTLQEQGKLEEAEVSYRQAIALQSDYAKAYNNLGATLQELSRLKEAEANFREAIMLKFDFVEAHYNLGIILQKLEKSEEAEASYREAIALKPEYTEAHYNSGNTLKEMGRLEEAEVSYREAIALKPEYAEAHNNLGNTLKELGKLEEAESSYRQAIALKPDYAEAKHLLASLIGEVTNSAPRVYVEKLFNGYASKFDYSLVDELEYRVPKLIAGMILKNHPIGILGSVLDLGCGTGLAGVEIKKYCTYLEGIDLSNSMLEKARNKNIYDKLTHRDILDFLATENLNFDYFISTDVFIYVGDLSDLFRLIKSRNRSGGKLVFSTENTDKEGFCLEKSGRYSHSKTYIESLCKRFNYKLSQLETINLRKEKDIFVEGSLYLLDF